MTSFRTLVFRAGSVPRAALPMGARSAGHYRVEPPHEESGTRKDFVQLFWGIAGEGEFAHGRERLRLGPEHVFVYFPGDEHRIRPVAGMWEYRWLTLDGPVNEAITRSFGLGRLVRRAGPCPEELFMQMEAHIRDVTPYGERRASAAAFTILALACGRGARSTSGDRAVGECVTRIEEEFADVDLTVDALARELRIHRSALSRLFRRRMGVSPQQYLISTRVQKAMSLLRETDMRVSEIAYATGYADPNYFARAMRKIVGVAPIEFRRQY